MFVTAKPTFWLVFAGRGVVAVALASVALGGWGKGFTSLNVDFFACDFDSLQALDLYLVRGNCKYHRAFSLAGLWLVEPSGISNDSDPFVEGFDFFFELLDSEFGCCDCRDSVGYHFDPLFVFSYPLYPIRFENPDPLLLLLYELCS